MSQNETDSSVQVGISKHDILGPMNSSIADAIYSDLELENSVPNWRVALNQIFHKHRPSLRRRKTLTFQESTTEMGSPTGGSSTVLLPTDESEDDTDSADATGGLTGTVKRSEEITSELDISRRTGLDVEYTLERWWVTQATAAHKRLVLFLIILAVLASCHLIMAIMWLASNNPKVNPYLCESAACKLVARDILSKMNESIDPCDDFFLFSCGKLWESSKIEKLSKKNKDNWALINKQIHYDFPKSTTIGKILRANDYHLLPFHKACMDIKRRNQLKLVPYFDMLEFFNLHWSGKPCDHYSPDPKKGQVKCALQDSLYGVTGLNIISGKPFHISISREQRTFYVGLQNSIEPPSVLEFGLDTYLSVVTKALTYMSKEGLVSSVYKTNWGNVQKIEAYAKLFTCAELNIFPYYHHGDAGPNVWNTFDPDKKIESLCKFHKPSGILRDGDFSSGQSLGKQWVALKWEDFLQDESIYKMIAPKNPQPDSAFDFHAYVNLLVGNWIPDFNDDNFRREIPNETIVLDFIFANYDLTVRFLQWLLLREYGYALDETLDRIFWPITRAVLECNWISTCIWTMFEELSFRSQEVYMRTVPAEDVVALEKLINNYYPIIEKLMPKFNFAKFATKADDDTGQQLAKRAFDSIQLSWPKRQYDVNASKVSTTATLRLLKLRATAVHFTNIISHRILYSAHANAVLQGFETDIYWDAVNVIKIATINRPVTFTCDKFRTKTQRVMPLGTYEPPYSGTYFPALDLGGVGIYAMSKLIETVTTDGMSLALVVATNISHPKCVDALQAIADDQEISNYHHVKNDTIIKKLVKGLNPDLWKIAGRPEMYNILSTDVNHLYSDQLCLQLALKLSYDVHEELIRKNETASKLMLPGLEKYSARKLLFIQSASRTCEVFSEAKLKHMQRHGPLPRSISINLLAANSKEFSKVFGCKAGARMNPVEKFNFYDD